ncbi:universal stress protein [Mucilaginibacter sp. Bleaf8]|uniref:universal stress protein n=1 Tax=Mucilaginibacter sp. Bleaf8 TaxID=2834430 RepID=UPI001BD1A296|nr:universal stress protein [Mucilaginibacter sp. Bleaf8]MBS7566093.1 universal stress protein [Mucilaginibacter sp. Bleaf8]
MEISRILIGIDNSKYADHAAAYGFGLARKFNASVGLATIIEPVPTTGSPMNDTTFGLPFEGTADLVNVEMMNAQNDAADTILNTTIQKYGSDLNVTQFTDFGSSGDGILSCAAQFNADLIVIGTHHRSGIDRLLMGSVAESVVRNATVPVLVVPLEGEEE